MNHLLLLFCTIIIVSFTSCTNSNNATREEQNTPAQPTYQETKMTLEDSEKANPLQFLKVSKVQYRQNLIDEWVVEGTVENHATVATYKDVVLDIVYYSKTETELGRNQETLYEFVAPNNYKTFKFKKYGFAGTALIGVELKSATAK